MIGVQARRWLRLRGQPITQQGKPRFPVVNLANPHDVVFYNPESPGQHVQDEPKPLSPIALCARLAEDPFLNSTLFCGVPEFRNTFPSLTPACPARKPSTLASVCGEPIIGAARQG
jgi:hypothetical protein